MRAPWQLVLLWGVVVGSGPAWWRSCSAPPSRALVRAAARARHGRADGEHARPGSSSSCRCSPRWPSTIGWRAVSLTLAVAARRSWCRWSLLLRDRPADLGLPPYGGPAIEPPPPAGRATRPGGALLALARGTRSRDFWLLAGSFFICGASTNGLIGTHLIPACVDHGIPEVQAAGLLAAMGVFDFVGTTALGLAVGPLRQPRAARVVLRAARPVAAVPAVRVPVLVLGAVAVRGVLRARLDRDRAAHRAAREPRLRRGERGA